MAHPERPPATVLGVPEDRVDAVSLQQRPRSCEQRRIHLRRVHTHEQGGRRLACPGVLERAGEPFVELAGPLRRHPQVRRHPRRGVAAVRIVAGEDTARRCFPFLVLAPMALWVATSMDALFMGVAAWGTSLLAMATGSRTRRGYVLAFGSGLLLGCGLYLTYGLGPFGLLPLAVIAARRRWRCRHGPASSPSATPASPPESTTRSHGRRSSPPSP